MFENNFNKNKLTVMKFYLISLHNCGISQSELSLNR